LSSLSDLNRCALQCQARARLLARPPALKAERFYSQHGFGPTTTYDLVRDERLYPPKAILGTAYEIATGQRLG
jgi:hypothetical protein